MIIVSGCPRSGTSLMMDLFRVALGEDRIIGAKFPQEPEPVERQAAAVEYLRDSQSDDARQAKADARDMNPNGFWECRWSVRGIQWEPNEPDKNKVSKIVSQGLARSNPAYIDKVVLMVRHPWQVANSHRDLKVNIPGMGNVRNKDMGNVSPQAYNQATGAVCRWILKHQPEVLQVNFDELLAKPSETLYRVSQFIGEGDWQEAAKQIDPKLKRSKPEQVNDHPSWGLSLSVHEKFAAGNYQGVVDVIDQAKADKPQGSVRFPCPRWGGNVNRMLCENCKSDNKATLNMMKTASRRKIEWWSKPCLWECGMNPDEKITPLTVEQSIADNHWVEASQGLGDKIATVAKALGFKHCGRCEGWRQKFNEWFPTRASKKGLHHQGREEQQPAAPDRQPPP